MLTRQAEQSADDRAGRDPAIRGLIVAATRISARFYAFDIIALATLSFVAW